MHQFFHGNRSAKMTIMPRKEARRDTTIIFHFSNSLKMTPRLIIFAAAFEAMRPQKNFDANERLVSQRSTISHFSQGESVGLSGSLPFLIWRMRSRMRSTLALSTS
jgi:hypothetical protein